VVVYGFQKRAFKMLVEERKEDYNAEGLEVRNMTSEQRPGLADIFLDELAPDMPKEEKQAIVDNLLGSGRNHTESSKQRGEKQQAGRPQGGDDGELL
jgi:hypothetical protein